MTMKWARPFNSILLVDGCAIASLAQARDFIASTPENSRAEAAWKYACEPLLKAADRNEKYTTADARAQMTRALRTGGFT
jgi:hypothetical protein